MLATVIYVGIKDYLIYKGITVVEGEVKNIIATMSKKSKKMKTEEDVIETYFVD